LHICPLIYSRVTVQWANTGMQIHRQLNYISKNSRMKKLLFVAAILFAGYYFSSQQSAPSKNASNTAQSQSQSPTRSQDNSDAVLASAFANQVSDLQVSGQGVVIKLLADDNSGSRHQKFIVRLANGQTLLVAHNIDLAPRVSGLSKGDSVMFNGEYKWSEKGGLLHWTHRDPDGSHPSGWLKHQGQTYQ
jgi:hypothetical protein